MAGIRTDEPYPRNEPLSWESFRPSSLEVERLIRPQPPGPRDFADVIRARRSELAGPVGWSHVAELLWHAAGSKGYADSGRAGVPIEWRASPSAGGLHPINLLCINDDADSRPRLYNSIDHAFHILNVDSEAIATKNATAVAALLGAHRGCTIRFIADISKVKAVYENADSLVLRDAGCLISTLCLCAEWLDLAACPLGFLGEEMVTLLGFPQPRFRAVGGVQITRR